jgi:enoyl-CoA hydratase
VPYEDYETLLFERPSDGVLVISMNRPEVLNAMTYRMHAELARVWRDVADDDETRVAVITGAGRGFSAGNDLKQPDLDGPGLRRLFREGQQIVYDMVGLEKPIISAINGAAVGAGLAVALCADISVAADDAKLIDGHTKVGMVAGDHAAMMWPLLTSMAKAKYYLLTCETLLGAEAERIGLVTFSVPRDDVLPRALAIAEQLARGSQEAIRWTKRALGHWQLQAGPIYELSAALENLQFFSADAHEARAAFREGRPVDFPSARTPAGAGA